MLRASHAITYTSLKAIKVNKQLIKLIKCFKVDKIVDRKLKHIDKKIINS